MEPRRQNQGGQAVVEFALILIILLMIIFVVIESARLFQANLTVQNAARDAGRYAITGEFDPSCLADDPPCDDPRLVSVKNQALAALSGLRLDPNATFNDPYYFLIEVFSLDDQDNWIPDTLGGPGDPVLVRVTYRLGIVTPIINSIARTVQLRGQVVYNNEETRQTSLTSGANPGSDDAPNLPPLPTTGPTPTATPVPPFLEITKSASESEVELDETFSYEIEVRNTGGGPATNVELTDVLPDEVGYESGGNDCTTPSTETGGTLTCSLGELASGASETITFVVQAVEVGLATNNAAVTSDEVGPVDASASTVIIDPASADLDIRKTVPSTQMTVGQEFDYEIRVRNLGPSEATDVVVTDALPDELEYVDATTTAGECEYDDGSHTLTCTNPGPFAANGPHMVITLSVVAAEAGPVSNTASVEAFEPDPVDNNNSSTATIFVDPVADMSIVKTVEPVEVGVREFMTYTLSITNNGPEPASNVTVIDDLPDGVGLVSISTPVGTCEQQPNTSAEILCLLGTLEADVTVNIEIVAIPTVGVTNVTNTATVGADELDPEQGNNSSSVNVFVEPRADLSITKIASESRVHVDDDFVYTLQVTNSPDSFTDAPNVTVSDQLDTERVTFVSAIASQGTCTVNQSGEVFCTLGDMAIGAEATIDITVDPRPVNAEGDGGGDLFNSAVVAYGGATDYEDLEPDDNEDDVTIYVGPGAETISLEPI
ncbi:MAG: TadE/TadG family type IV pilus assembly protein, partial [Chloroflexota bacterium]